MSLMSGVFMPPVYAVSRDWHSLVGGWRETGLAAVGGLVSVIGYGIVICAMSLGPMGAVSALRETSVVFAALIGWLFLRERLTAYRIAACIVVATGAIFIGHAM